MASASMVVAGMPGSWAAVSGGVVFAFEVFGDFAAEEALGDGVIGVAFEAGGVASWVNLDEERAGVWTVQGADRMAPGGRHEVRVAGMWKIFAICRV